MNVVEAIDKLTTIIEVMQDHRKEQDKKIEALENRANLHEAILGGVGLIAVLGVIFFN